MTSKEALYLLMTNQKKVRDDFKFINLNTHEKVSIEECYDIIIKDLERLETYDKTKKIYGIDLSTLSKATQQGIWVKHNNVFYFFDNLIVDFKHKCLVQIVSNDEVETFPFDSYGEDWALSREELENGRQR